METERKLQRHFEAFHERGVGLVGGNLQVVVAGHRRRQLVFRDPIGGRLTHNGERRIKRAEAAHRQPRGAGDELEEFAAL